MCCEETLLVWGVTDIINIEKVEYYSDEFARNGKFVGVIFYKNEQMFDLLLIFCNAKSIISICTRGKHYEKNGTS